MHAPRMVPLTWLPDAFSARVIAARLGAAGLLSQLRGSLDGPYPIGGVEVLVPADELEEARELLLADDVESAFDADAGGLDESA